MVCFWWFGGWSGAEVSELGDVVLFREVLEEVIDLCFQLRDLGFEGLVVGVVLEVVFCVLGE